MLTRSRIELACVVVLVAALLAFAALTFSKIKF